MECGEDKDMIKVINECSLAVFTNKSDFRRQEEENENTDPLGEIDR